MEAIIDPATFNLVQEKMAERKPYAHKISNTSVFSNKLVCGDCGEFYGRKTWHGKDYEEYYRVWYCNDKYNGEKCLTPALREDTILEAFQDALDKREDKPRVASKKLWKELVDRVVVHTDRRMVFRFKDGIVSEATAPK